MTNRTDPNWGNYASGIVTYAKTNPGYSTGYALGWAAFGASAAFLVAGAACPAMIPFAFAQAGFWVKAIELTVAAGVFAGTGACIVGPQIAKPILITHARNQQVDGVVLSVPEQVTHSVLLGSVALASVAFVAGLFLAPAMLPFGLAAVAAYSMWLQAGIALALTATAVASTITMVGLWKDKPSATNSKISKVISEGVLEGGEPDGSTADADEPDSSWCRASCAS